MNYKHPNLFVMIPYEERNRVSGYFDLSVVGEEYAKLLGDLTDELSTYAVSKNDVGENAVIIPILRAGMSMSNRLTKRLPKADVARISMRRNLHTLKPFVAWDEFEQIKEPESKRVFITDPALATAGSILKTLEHMKKYGFKDENVVIILCSPKSTATECVKLSGENPIFLLLCSQLWTQKKIRSRD